MNMVLLVKKRISWRVLVLLILAIGILSYLAMEIWQYTSYMNKLRNDGWYIVTICDDNHYNCYIMVDADNIQELYEDIQTYSVKIKNHPEIKNVIERSQKGGGDVPVEIYFLIPNAEINFGEKKQCHHGFYVNQMCKVCDEQAVAKIIIDTNIPIDENLWHPIEINR